jgi:hypothetical protein
MANIFDDDPPAATVVLDADQVPALSSPPAATADRDDDDDERRSDETDAEAAVRLLTKWTKKRQDADRLYRKRVRERSRKLSIDHRHVLLEHLNREHELLLDAIGQHSEDGADFSFPPETGDWE